MTTAAQSKEERKSMPLDLLDLKRKECIRKTLVELCLVDDVIGLIVQFAKQDKILILSNSQVWTFDASTKIWKEYELPIETNGRVLCDAFVHNNQLVTLALQNGTKQGIYQTITLNLYSGFSTTNVFNINDESVVHRMPIQYSKGMMHAKFWDDEQSAYTMITFDVLQSRWSLNGYPVKFDDLIFSTPHQDRIYAIRNGAYARLTGYTFCECVDGKWQPRSCPPGLLFTYSCYTIHQNILYICGFAGSQTCYQYDMVQDKWTILPSKKHKGSLSGDMAIVVENILYCIVDQHMEAYALNQQSEAVGWQYLAACPTIFNHFIRTGTSRTHTIL